MKRILFVDDEPNVLQGLSRLLRPMRQEWKMEFAGSGAAALEIMEREPCDVVISDMRMPGMSGAELLDEVRRRYPQTVRIVLSGQTDKSDIVRSVDPVHQYLAKPCDAELLVETVNRAFALRGLLATEPLKRLVSQMESLPSLPTLYHQLMHELHSANASLHNVEKIISQDMGMAAKMLQMVNSAFFGLRRRVTSPGQAVMILGLDTIKGLALSSHVFSQVRQSRLQDFSLDRLWKHSMLVGGGARAIAHAAGGDARAVDYAFTAGMMHDVGKLILANEMSAEYKRMRKTAGARNLPIAIVEQESLAATHAEVGAYLLGLWGLPDPILEAVAYHHQPGISLVKNLGPLAAVHVADALADELIPDPDAGGSPLDLPYLTHLGIADRVTEWQRLLEKMIAES
ncbi:MAG: HDOD domain-containing protein [Myxococcales bacterium]|nr:HDOD domain-containing protein [Myxococcales bacterium]